MAEDYTHELVADAIKNLYSEWKADGLSDDEIILRVTDTKLEKVLDEITDRMSEDSIDWLKLNMYE